MGNKIAREVAEQDFDRFAEEMDLDLNPQGMDEEDRKGLEKQKETILSAIMSGRLIIDESGQPVFTPREGEPIVFHEPTGATYMAMDSKKKSQDVGKLFAAMADMTKVPAGTFSKMPNRDLKVCMAVMTLFLG